METVTNNFIRVGNFTSSEIAALMAESKDGGLGKPALTYIEETNMERRLMRSISEETNARPTTWGKLVETHVFNILPTQYRLCSTETIQHPEIEYWVGSPDCEKFDDEKTVVDIKCPKTLKSFCQLVDAGKIGIDAVRETHKDGEKYYWQLVSNAILTGAKFAELIVYCPYKSELETIRELSQNVDQNQNQFAWINWSEDNELPYLIDGGYYKNLNIIRFEVPETDKAYLTERVLLAGKLLQEFKNKI